MAAGPLLDGSRSNPVCSRRDAPRPGGREWASRPPRMDVDGRWRDRRASVRLPHVDGRRPPPGGPRRAGVGFATVQVFTKSNNQWKAKPLTDADVAALPRRAGRDGRRRPGGPQLLPHQPGQPRRRPLEQVDRRHDRGGRARRGARADRPGLPTPARTSAAARRPASPRIAAGLDEVHRRTAGCRLRIALETTAGQGSNLGHRFEHLGAIFDRVAEPERLGVCVDTCHIFAAGYPLEHGRGVQSDDRRAGPGRRAGRVRVWHLNDSVRELGSRVDRHAGIGRGGSGLAAFRLLVNDPRFAGLPMILETPKGEEGGEELDAINLRCSGDSVAEGPDLSHRARQGRAEPRPGGAAPMCDRTSPTAPTPARHAPRHPGLAGDPRPDPSHYINRELSWLAFDERVLEEARDPSNPLLERLNSWRSRRRTSTSSSRSASRASRPSSTTTSSRRTRRPTAWGR